MHYPALPKGFDLNKFIDQALREDIGDGDHTSLATIDQNKTGAAKLLVKESGVIAGVELAVSIFKRFDKKLKVIQYINDGEKVKKGDVVFIVRGRSSSILTTERLVLNCMQRMSGIATKTNSLVQLCRGTKAKVLDTRKTTPLFRPFEKWAVAIGGGTNHRFGLYDMILIKDNHIDYAGGVSNALRKTKEYLKKKKKTLPIEIETRNINEIKEVLLYGGIDRILLDNFSPVEIKKAIKLINGKFKTEASGNITEKNIRRYALSGVDFISSGALTHSIKSLDLSLKAIENG